MAKINIPFNGAEYNIDESALSTATAELKTHLSTVMNGTGAIINLGGTSYNVDSTKLSTATNTFISHLGTVAGNGSKVVVNGVTYNVDSTKMSGAVADLETVLGGLHSNGEGSDGTILSERTWTTWWIQAVDAFGIYLEFSEDTPAFPLVIGDKCTVVWDGTEYEVVVNDLSFVADGMLYIGNGAASGLSGNNEPFFIAWDSMGVTILSLVDADTGIEHTTAIYKATNSGGGENNEYRVIMPETTMADFSQEDGAYTTSIDFVPEVGNEYLIKYNGNTYNCVARSSNDDLPPFIKQEICLGNAMVYNDPTIYGDDDTGEPFFITVLDFIDGAPRWYFYSLNDNPCTISISEKLPSSSDTSFTPGLYQTGAIALYNEQGAEAIEGMLITSWDELVANGTVHVEDGVVYSNFDEYNWENPDADSLSGDLVLPNDGSVTKIGNYVESTDEGQVAFSGCVGLTNIVIPNTVTSIGEYAFEGCTSLTSVTIPNGVISIGNYAFAYCESLTSVNIPDSVDYIGYDAFYEDTNLVGTTFDNAVYLGNAENPYKYLHQAVNTDINSVVIHSNTKFIGSCAFDSCENLTNVEIPDTVTSINSSAFYRCTSLASIEIPASVTSIGVYAFNGCSSLTSVMIPYGVTCINQNTFNSSGLTHITIPDSVTLIHYGAFQLCASLTSVDIPTSVTFIDSQAFGDCDALTQINYNGTTAQWNAITKYSDWNYDVPAIYVQCSDGTVTLIEK